jgi:hypothetical protein
MNEPPYDNKDTSKSTQSTKLPKKNPVQPGDDPEVRGLGQK